MNKPLVLIIEDDLELSEIFSSVLQAIGAETEIVGDGNLAMGKITSLKPTVIILDMHLPNVSGLEILKQVRSDTNLSKLKVVVSTADALIAQMCEPQADMVLIKPVTYSQISTLVSRIMQPVPSQAPPLNSN